MRSGQKFLTTFVLWTFAMALPLRPVIVILHNTFSHAPAHKVVGLPTLEGQTSSVPHLSKHFNHLKKVPKRVSRPEFLPIPPSRSVFRTAGASTRASLPGGVPPPCPSEVLPLRI